MPSEGEDRLVWLGVMPERSAPVVAPTSPVSYLRGVRGVGGCWEMMMGEMGSDRLMP